MTSALPVLPAAPIGRGRQAQVHRLSDRRQSAGQGLVELTQRVGYGDIAGQGVACLPLAVEGLGSEGGGGVAEGIFERGLDEGHHSRSSSCSYELVGIQQP